MLPQELLESIVNKTCIAFVGSGPSCEMGYPSWEALAREAMQIAKEIGTGIDDESYDLKMKSREYEAIFGLLERDLGSRAKMIEIVNSLMETHSPLPDRNGKIYRIIANWPFKSYITTNFDNALAESLSQHGYYETLRNSNSDMKRFLSNPNELILKIHSDLTDGDNAVLTDDDYDKCYVHTQKECYRQYLKQIFAKYTIFFIGHSLYDPDIKHILKMAQEVSSTGHKHFMIQADAEPGMKYDYDRKYNTQTVNRKSY